MDKIPCGCKPEPVHLPCFSCFRASEHPNQSLSVEFELDADTAIIRHEDDRLVIEPVRKKGLLATLASLNAIEEDLPDIDSGLPPLDDVNL